mgnify:CR=1 FL=1
MVDLDQDVIGLGAAKGEDRAGAVVERILGRLQDDGAVVPDLITLSAAGHVRGHARDLDVGGHQKPLGAKKQRMNICAVVLVLPVEYWPPPRQIA